MKKYRFCFIVIFLIFRGTSFSQNDTELQKANGLNFIKAENLITTVEYFASPELKGRLSGSPGYYKAADYAANIFKTLGLKAGVDNSYFQKFLIEYNEIKSPCLFYLITQDDEARVFRLGDDYVCRGFSGSGKFIAPVVFCGYGIDDEVSGYNDYGNIDVKGKVVIIFKQDPQWLQNFGGNPNLRFRANLAAEKGAKAVLLVSKPNDRNPQKPIGSVMDGSGDYNENLPILHIDISVANELLEKSGYTLKELQTQIDSLKKPFSVDVKRNIGMDIKTEYSKEKETVNVIGILEGSDPVLKDECIVIGAHLDHAGEQAGTIYFPGANDNASGSAAVIEIAKTFIQSNIKPRRSIIFILFSNEESGLLGAQYYTENPVFPIGKTIAMLNMDCVGYGDSIQIGNGESAPELWKIAKSNNDKYINMMVPRTWKGGGADATPFHQKNIPCLYIVTTKSYDHLHLTTDKPETLNKPLYEKITRLAFLTLVDISNGDYIREPLRN